MVSSSTSSFSRSALSIWLLSVAIIPIHASFNYEVEKRVFERINDFMSGPVIVTSLLERFLSNGAFPNDLSATDKDAYSTLAYSLLNEYKFDMLYYGTEDGIFVGYSDGIWGTYREPVNSGYKWAEEPDMLKYYEACVNRETGEPETCTMSPGSQYVQCIDNCELAPCEDEATQNCETSSDSSCKREQKWCPKYSVEVATVEDAGLLGYVPRTYHCHTPTGAFSQEPGEVLEKDGQLGNCKYGDDRTLVNRDIVGDYVLCAEGENQTCNPFLGGFRSRDYDPRYRSWYLQTKAMQRPNWVEPYPFFSELDLGITYSQPFYSYDEATRRQVFRGVFAVDYTFEDIKDFLLESYGSSSPTSENDNINIGNSTVTDETYVVIYEANYPNFMVAASTGRKAATKVLKSDPSIVCPDAESDQDLCEVQRLRMSDVEGRPNDEILKASYLAQVDRNYPRDLVDARVSDEPGSPAYVSQSSFYTSGEDLEWIILVISPIEESESDAVTPESPLFSIVCVVASLGFALCFAMFLTFIAKRKHRAVILADWRFTSAFLMGCALLNLSSFTFLGENTTALCMVRMWVFHFLFAVALSPLFVKVYRMYRLVGSEDRNPEVISNPKAVALTLPIVIIQVIILGVFSIVDPPQPENIIEFDGSTVIQMVECKANSNAFSITVLAYEASLIMIGCILAFITRNLDSGFGQAKELMFSMYNIAFIGIVILVIAFAMEIDASGQIILFSLGIFSATVFSSAAFVLPRIIQSNQESRVGAAPRRRSTANRSRADKNRSRRSVNFSQNLEQEIDDKPVTGWSGVEDDFEDAASGLKRASSIASLPEDEVWTQANDNASLISGSLVNASTINGTRTDEKMETYKDEMAFDKGDTWGSSTTEQLSPNTRGRERRRDDLDEDPSGNNYNDVSNNDASSA